MHPAFRLTVLMLAAIGVLDFLSPGAGRWGFLPAPLIVAVIVGRVRERWQDAYPRRPQAQPRSSGGHSPRSADSSRLGRAGR